MLNDDYREMLQILSEEGVEFLIVGAYALAAHGYPRATGDIDIWVNPDTGNAQKVYAALKRFGSPLFTVTPEDFTVKGTIFQIGVVPRRIDIITAISGVDYSDARRDAVMLDIDGLPVPVLSIEKIIINKESTGREKDALDVKQLRARRRS
ncbi:MAG TPA: hypothetical protein ENN21_07360 [Spirochaetes bacterium]|nr:hypothetical protein [Spirochaetota bacterium]